MRGGEGRGGEGREGREGEGREGEERGGWDLERNSVCGECTCKCNRRSVICK